MAIQKLPSDDLSDLKPDLILKAFARVLVGRYKEKPASLLARSTLRLVDQAVREYQHAFAELHQFLSTYALESFLRSQGHLETCVLSMHRALNFANRLRQFHLTLPDGSLLIPKSKELEVLTDPVRDRIRKIRNAIAHIDEQMTIGSFPVGRVIAIDPTNNGIALENVVITWDELTRWLRQLYMLGERFST
jgi:hypothetical protein